VDSNETSSSSASSIFCGSPLFRFSLVRAVHAALLVAVAAVGPGSMPAAAQESATIQGDFVGILGPLPLKLHIQVAADGSLNCTLDSESQGALPRKRVAGSTLRRRIPSAIAE
jgi:hypothetical protein